MNSINISILNNDEITKHKPINKFKNLKGDYFFKKVINNIDKKKLLEIIKYNKKLQQILKIDINDYKEYSEKFSSIEIEIIPYQNKKRRFISINKIEEAKYYHIQFNGNKLNEIQRINLIKNEKVNKINIVIDHQIISFNQLFSNCNCIESICFKKFYRNNINDMSYMFDGCSSLKEINFSNFNTDNVTDMSYMFWGCRSLVKLNLSNFNTNKVIDMSLMFDGCSTLKELNISNFIINDETKVNNMFFGCSDDLKIKIKERFKKLEEEAFYN